MATYTRRDDGRIGVVNECRDGSFDGEWRRAEGVAWVTDEEKSRAKLKVQFFWPFRGDYWIIELDPEYRYAAVGHPSRNYLWILARTPTLDPCTPSLRPARGPGIRSHPPAADAPAPCSLGAGPKSGSELLPHRHLRDAVLILPPRLPDHERNVRPARPDAGSGDRGRPAGLPEWCTALHPCESPRSTRCAR